MRMDKVDRLKTMPTEEVKNKVLIPLFRSMGYTEILRREGIPGYGDEITCCKNEDIGKTYVCLQVIPKNVTDTVSERVFTNEVFMLTQHAVRTPIVDREDGRRNYASIFLLITPEECISKEMVLKDLKNWGIDAKVDFMGLETILKLIEIKMEGYIWEKGSIPLSACEGTLGEFENMLENPDLSENDFKQFFKRNPWLLGVGLDYKEISSEQRAGAHLQVDFLLKTYEGYCDIMELERHTDEVMVGTDQDWKLSSKCEASFWQIHRYMEYCERNVAYESYESGINVYRPQGFIVIGRSKEENMKKLRSVNSRYNHIKILTYDDMYQRAKRWIETSKQLSSKEVGP